MSPDFVAFFLSLRVSKLFIKVKHISTLALVLKTKNNKLLGCKAFVTSLGMKSADLKDEFFSEFLRLSVLS